MRNNELLRRRLSLLWQKYFYDLPKKNTIQIKFGSKVKKRLGSIRRINKLNEKNFDTLITVNGHFRDEKIPLFVIDATIAHELCHYAHGFSSPLPKLHPFPHKGQVVDREMVERGLGGIQKEENSWLQKNWLRYLSYYRAKLA